MRRRHRPAHSALVKARHAKTLPAPVPDGSIHGDRCEQDRLAAHRKSVGQRENDQRDQHHIDLAMTPEPPPYDGTVGRSQMKLGQYEIERVKFPVAVAGMTRIAASSPTEAPPQASQKSARREKSQRRGSDESRVCTDIGATVDRESEYRKAQLAFILNDVRCNFCDLLCPSRLCACEQCRPMSILQLAQQLQRVVGQVRHGAAAGIAARQGPVRSPVILGADR